MKQSSKNSASPAIREANWYGIMPATASLISGEVLQVDEDYYLIMTVGPDPATGELFFYAAKVNATLTLMRLDEDTDDDGNITQEWDEVSDDIYAFGQIITASLRQQDPGLLDVTEYVFYVAKTIGAQALDRIIYNGANYRVESIDDVGLPGVTRLQLAVDIRP
jgi:hypothetical protein